MKKKTANAVICKKFDEFAESITDLNVRFLVQKNTVITGGCIASMLLGEPVNDFDLYFTNKETALAVAKYYVDQFNEAEGNDAWVGDGDDSKTYEGAGGVALNMHPGRVKILIKSAGISMEGNSSDYNMGMDDDQSEQVDIVSILDDMPMEVLEAKPKYRPIFLTGNAITLSDKVQIVVRFYGEPDQIHDTYDFIHCTNYWTSKERKLVLNQAALESLLSKELQYIGSKYPLCSVIRTRKFLKRGWTVNAGQYLKMLFQTSELDLKNVAVLEDQLIGVDYAFFSQLIEQLQKKQEKEAKEGRKFEVNYGYIATIIDKIM